MTGKDISKCKISKIKHAFLNAFEVPQPQNMYMWQCDINFTWQGERMHKVKKKNLALRDFTNASAKAFVWKVEI